MKTIFRFIGFGVLLAAFVAVGNVAGFGQDPCANTDAITALGDKIRDLFPKKEIENQKAKINAAKEFMEKYASCESGKDMGEYLKPRIPQWEATLKAAQEAEVKNALITKFNAGLKNKNWEDVYSAGKELLDKYPDEFRAVELVLGSIGLDETAKTPSVTKWNDETIRFAKASIADLEGGKTFSSYGVDQFKYKSKDDALGWMNYTIGYIIYFDKKNKKDGIGYIYKASQLNSDTKTNPVIFGTIGAYYYEDVRRLAGEVKTLIDAQKPEDTPEVAKQKVDEIKAKVGILNGTTERALDAYGRAYKLIPATDTAKAKYRESLRKNMEDLYKARFVKPEVPLDTWVATATAKPFPDPLSAVAPINDPEPVTTTGDGVGAANGTGVGKANGNGTGAVNGTGVGGAKPAGTTTTPAKPATPPVKKPGTHR